MGTKVLALMNMGFFVDAALLNKGIYYTSIPCLYKDGTTIKSLVDAGKTIQDMLGHSSVSDEYLENLKQCELVKVEISPITDKASTSQQQTIERLRDVLCEIMDYRKGNGNYNFSNLTKDDRDLAAIEAWGGIELKIEQLLNTTEPIDLNPKE